MRYEARGSRWGRLGFRNHVEAKTVLGRAFTPASVPAWMAVNEGAGVFQNGALAQGRPCQ